MAVNRVLTNGAIDPQFNFPVRRLNLRLPQSDVPRNRVELKVRDILSHTSLVVWLWRVGITYPWGRRIVKRL